MRFTMNVCRVPTVTALVIGLMLPHYAKAQTGTPIEITPPDGLVTETYYANIGVTMGSVSFENFYKVLVGTYGDDVYIKGIFSVCPDGWIKGTKNGNMLTFSRLQIQGTYKGETIYAAATDGYGNPSDFKFEYQPEDDCYIGYALLAITSSTTTDYRAFSTTFITILKDDLGEMVPRTGGTILSLPYSNSLQKHNEYGVFGRINSNNDLSCWAFNYLKGTYYDQSDQPADDWFVSPAVNLMAGMKYRISISAYSSYTLFPERIEIKAGTKSYASAMTLDVLPPTDITNGSYQVFETDSFMVSQTGFYHFGIHAISDANAATLYIKDFQIEPAEYRQAPGPIEVFSVDTVHNRLLANISLQAPTRNNNGDELTEGVDSIQIVRDDIVIHTFLPTGKDTHITPGQELNYTDQDTLLTLGLHTYHALAYNRHGAGTPSRSQTVRLTTVHEVPYLIDMAKNVATDFFDVIDANNDDNSWEWIMGRGFLYHYSYDHLPADDYLVLSSPLRLETGRYYRFDADLSSLDQEYPQRVLFKTGEKMSVDGLDIIIMDTTTVTNKDSKIYGTDFEVSHDGEYYMALQVVSEPDMYNLYVAGLNITKGPLFSAPDSVYDFSVTPSDDGALQAAISFSAPVRTAHGEDLTGNVSIEIYRDGELVHTLENITPGSPVNWLDTQMDDKGLHSWEIITANDSGQGIKSNRITAYLGLDIPSLEYWYSTDCGTYVQLDWGLEEKGVNGGYIVPEDISYVIYNAEIKSIFGFDVPVLTDPIDTVRTTTYILNINTNQGAQGYRCWGVIPMNEAGKGSEGYFSIWTGEPYRLPVQENFANASFSYEWATESHLQKYFVKGWDSDGDGCSLYLIMEENAPTYQGVMWSGKLALKGTTNPTLLFDISSFDSGSRLRIMGFDPQNNRTDLFDMEATQEEYRTISVPLDQARDNGVTQLAFVFNFYDIDAFHIIDNIRILDLPDYDLSVSFESDREAYAGDTVNIDVQVMNEGAKTVGDFTLYLKANGQTFYQKTFREQLSPMESMSVEAGLPTSFVGNTDYVVISAEIESDYDLEFDNNYYEDELTILTPDKVNAATGDELPFNIYSIDGKLIRSNVKETDNLKGRFIINNRIIFIK